MSSFLPMLNLPDALTPKPLPLALVVVVSWRNCRARPATLTWPQSPFFVQRTLMSGSAPSSLLVRVVLR